MTTMGTKCLSPGEAVVSSRHVAVSRYERLAMISKWDRQSWRLMAGLDRWSSVRRRNR